MDANIHMVSLCMFYLPNSQDNLIVLKQRIVPCDVLLDTPNNPILHWLSRTAPEKLNAVEPNPENPIIGSPLIRLTTPELFTEQRQYPTKEKNGRSFQHVL
ncbi:hypothetical protein PS2_040126 [Malus domestica]